MDRDHCNDTRDPAVSFPDASGAPARPSAAGRVGAVLRWTVALLACAWIAWCTAIGPLMRADAGLAGFGWTNALVFVVMFAVCAGIVVGLRRRALRPRPRTPLFACLPLPGRRETGSGAAGSDAAAAPGAPRAAPGRARLVVARFDPPAWLRRAARAVGRAMMRATGSWRSIWLVLALVWLWAPVTLLSAYGADVRSQAREFAWAWNQWTGLEQPYIGFFSFVPMDIYPTAHYMWPDSPTYLTDQHNIVLTVVYGAACAVSRYFTESNDAGLVVLSVLQWLFAGFCLASAANRFLNMPWLARDGTAAADFAHPERLRGPVPVDFAHPERGMRAPRGSAALLGPGRPAGPVARLLIMLLFACCPIVVFSTISLTKSPLFAFAFAWWFGLMYELYMTAPRRSGREARRPRAVTLAALFVSCAVMLVSAKYAWYIIVLQVVLSLVADPRRWRTYLLTLLLPTVLIHGSIAMLIQSGSIISGDPIESRGAQLQMIARVAQRNPGAIPQSAKDRLAPIFNIDQMAQAYRPQDADPVKSSGIQSKKVSYRWRSVTAEDMKAFDEAWIEIVRADPRTALDALFAKSYGYFDVFDAPYVPMTYYVNNGYVQDSSTWIRYYNHDWRNKVADTANWWSSIPVLGWVVHGNLYVVLTLLLGAAELVLRRWRALSWHMPLLLLMGVMITAPANNFERHMLPLVFVFGFLCLMFARDTRRGVDRGPAPRRGRA